jgi:hypothetical protein
VAQEVKKCGDDPTPGFLVHENEHWTQEHEKETQLQKKDVKNVLWKQLLTMGLQRKKNSMK